MLCISRVTMLRKYLKADENLEIVNIHGNRFRLVEREKRRRSLYCSCTANYLFAVAKHESAPKKKGQIHWICPFFVR